MKNEKIEHVNHTLLPNVQSSQNQAYPIYGKVWPGDCHVNKLTPNIYSAAQCLSGCLGNKTNHFGNR